LNAKAKYEHVNTHYLYPTKNIDQYFSHCLEREKNLTKKAITLNCQTKFTFSDPQKIWQYDVAGKKCNSYLTTK